MPNAPHPPVQALSAREAGQAVDDALYEGVPAHLLAPLQEWAYDFLTDDLARRVALRLRLDFHDRNELTELDGAELLDVVDLALQLDPELDYEQRTYEIDYASWNDFLQHGFPAVVEFDNDRPVRWPGRRGQQAANLRHLLNDAGSTFTTTWSPTPRLIRRVDPTVTAAVEQTLSTAPPPAGDLLRQAWNKAYGLHPDPTTAYRDAVRAVEAIACPLVLDKAAANNSATLGKVRDHLRDAPHKWQFVLLARDGDGSVEPLVAMLDRLWTGQVSRHAGGQNSRDQTPAEAQAAVHIAATLLQLLGAGALTQRGTP